MTRRQKRKIDRSVWKKNLDPLLRSLRGPPRIVLHSMICRVKTPSVKAELKLPKVTPAMSRKDRSRTVKVKETTTEPDQRDQANNKIPKPFKFVEDETKMEGWKYEELARMYEWKVLNNLLSNDPVLQVLKPELIDEN